MIVPSLKNEKVSLALKFLEDDASKTVASIPCEELDVSVSQEMLRTEVAETAIFYKNEAGEKAWHYAVSLKANDPGILTLITIEPELVATAANSYSQQMRTRISRICSRVVEEVTSP